MRRPATLFAAAAAFLGVLVAPATANAGQATTIKSAEITINNGDPDLFEPGDQFVLSFQKPLTPSLFTVDEPTIRVVDATGRSWLLEPGVDGFGVRFVLTGKKTITVTSIDEENLLVFPLTIIGANIYGKNLLKVDVAGSRDRLID